LSRRIHWMMVAILASVLVTHVSASVAYAQYGGLFLLVPFGARAVGQGEATVADSTLGTEAMWWNAASLAKLNKQELAIHYSQTLIATSNMLAYARPSKVLGTIAASAFLVDYGDQQATDANGQPLGTLSNRNYQLAVSYASPMGRRLSAGLTYKLLMLRRDCIGICNDIPAIAGTTTALDLGALYVLPTKVPVSLGVSVRNLGPALQVNDAEQADPLPRVVQIGIRGRVPVAALAARRAQLDAAADILNAPALGGGAASVGLTLSYQQQLFLRGGYSVRPGEGGGPALGIGFERGSLAIDIAQRYDAISNASGQTPIFVTLRARF
jgi:hypothetical protein